MPPTPNLPDLSGGYGLRPVSKAILPMVIDAYSEDPESAKAALPWLRSDEDITRQLSDMLHDLEHLSNADRVHFWSIHDLDNTFIGLIGLGAVGSFELQPWLLGSKRIQKSWYCIRCC